ncbi:MAG TPA: alcohol dehydrogenase catalytic domain-containing protein [Acidimicrobiales bacterium]|nr:alcohol dehydrogenase catalytic domain-containing protein [Acidimicrobiales bacterium]
MGRGANPSRLGCADGCTRCSLHDAPRRDLNSTRECFASPNTAARPGSSGLVSRVGPGVTRLHEGDRVAIPWLGRACGACGACGACEACEACRVDLAETFELHADGRTHIVRESRKLEDVNESIGQVERGEIEGRIVFDLR